MSKADPPKAGLPASGGKQIINSKMEMKKTWEYLAKNQMIQSIFIVIISYEISPCFCSGSQTERLCENDLNITHKIRKL